MGANECSHLPKSTTTAKHYHCQQMEKPSPYSIFTRYLFQNVLIWVCLPSSSKALLDSNLAWGSYSTALLLQNGQWGKKRPKTVNEGGCSICRDSASHCPSQCPHDQGLPSTGSSVPLPYRSRAQF